MKLVFLIDNGKIIGGGDYAQFKFAEYLAKRGHEVTVFASNKNEFLRDFSEIPNLELKFSGEIPRFMKGIGRLNIIWRKAYTKSVVGNFVRKNAKSLDYIIGYLRESAVDAVNLGKKYGIKTANFIFENPEWMKKQLGERFLKEYKGRFKDSWERARKAYLETDILIPNSRLVKDECSAWLGMKIEEPVYPGVEKIIPNSAKIKEENQVIYVGRLNDYKNVNEIILAISMVENSPKLVIVGSGEEEEKLRELARKLKVECEFKGRLTDREKQKEILKSKFMVFPSSFEGFGMPPAEALVNKKACICSDIPIFREIYKNKVEYFKEHDVKSLAEKIKKLLSDKSYRRKIGSEGKKFIEENYSWEKSAAAIEKILKSRIKK